MADLADHANELVLARLDGLLAARPALAIRESAEDCEDCGEPIPQAPPGGTGLQSLHRLPGPPRAPLNRPHAEPSRAVKGDTTVIKAIDEMLKLWAEEMHAPGSNGGGYAGGNLIAMLIASKGEVVRGHRGSRVILDRVAEVDRLVNRLPEELKTVVVEHYLNRDSFPEQKYRHCGCSRNTFYLRLHVAHQGIQDGLLRRAA